MTQDASVMLQQAIATGSVDDILRAGAAALQTGRYEEALGVVENAARMHPNHARLLHLLGLLHRNLDNLQSALTALTKAAELSPGDALIAQALAAVRYEAGLPAIESFARARELAPANDTVLLQYAAALIAAGRSDEAIEALDDEVAQKPGWLRGHTVLARHRWAHGQRDSFGASFERALLDTPREVPLWRAYIEALLAAELYEDVLGLIARARAAAGDHATFDAAEAIARSETGQIEQADRLFRRVAHIRDIALTVQLLRFLLRAGRADEVVRIGESYAANDPTNQILPYLSLGWRLTGNPNWEWLEGDPRFVGVFDIADRLPKLDVLAGRLRSIHKAVHQPFDQSLRGGTQTQDQLLPRIEPEIQALRKAIVETVEEYVDQLPPPQPGHPLLIEKRRPISFAGSWSVRLTDGGRHINHVHPAGWISSALYISLPEEIGSSNDQAGWLTLGEATELGLDLPPIRMVEPKPGRLVLFPSTMWHGTRQFTTGERLTVAFDVKRPA